MHGVTARAYSGHGPAAAAKPLIGILCCNEYAGRPVQTVASRFVRPIAEVSGAAVLLVPAISDACDLDVLAERLDGLLLTGSRSHVAPHRYGADGHEIAAIDEQRDEVALSLAGRMIEAGRPVFGICRGLQELNVLFGGTLMATEAGRHHHPEGHTVAFEQLFDHLHDVELTEDALLSRTTQERRVVVNSVHEQGIDRLGGGLTVEAVSPDDGLIEGFSARPCGGQVLAVQWHPEWAMEDGINRRFFLELGAAARGGQASMADVA